MTFVSPTFVFIFLPVVMTVYALTTKYRRTDLLPIISTAFFVCVNIHDLYSIIYYFSMAICAIVAIKLYKASKKRVWLDILRVLAALVAVAMIVYRMLFGFGLIYQWGFVICLMNIISMCSDILHEQGRVPDSIWEGLIYITFFPVSLAGPFVRYGDFTEKLDRADFSLDNFVSGLIRFLIGFVKCVAISAPLEKFYNDVMVLRDSFGLWVHLLMAAVFGFVIYSFLSGYSDMGRGIALMLGIRIDKDFGDPFVNVTPGDYMRRFFTGFSDFCKHYIVDPVDNIFAKGRFGRFVCCVIGGAFYVSVFCRSAEVAILLFLPAMAVSFFVMFRPRSKRMKIHTLLKIPCAAITFIIMTLVWGVVGLGGIGQVEQSLKHIFETPASYVSFEALEKLAALKYTLVPIVAAVLLLLVSCATRERTGSGEKDYTVAEIVVRSVAIVILILMFVICLTMLLPQFPNLGTFENGAYFV